MSYEGPLESQSHRVSYEGPLESESLVMRVHWSQSHVTRVTRVMSYRVWSESHELRGSTGVRVISYEGPLELESCVTRVHWRQSHELRGSTGVRVISYEGPL